MRAAALVRDAGIRRATAESRDHPKTTSFTPPNEQRSVVLPVRPVNFVHSAMQVRSRRKSKETPLTVQNSALITGAAGFIGSHLVERCLDLGWRVIALDSFTDYYSEGLKRQNLAEFADEPACTVIEGDLLEVDLVPILGDVTIVFHLAAQAGVRTSWDQFSQYTIRNVDATQRLWRLRGALR